MSCLEYIITACATFQVHLYLPLNTVEGYASSHNMHVFQLWNNTLYSSIVYHTGLLSSCFSLEVQQCTSFLGDSDSLLSH